MLPMLFFASESAMRAQYVCAGTPVPVKPVSPTKGSINKDTHLPHKSPAAYVSPIDVFFDAGAPSIHFVTTENEVSFVYSIKDLDGQIILSDSVCLVQGQQISVAMPFNSVSAFVVELEVDGILYEGLVEADVE